MALFGNFHGGINGNGSMNARRSGGHRPVRRILVIQEPEQLPAFLKRLDTFCHECSVHPLPVRMKFIAEALSDRGQPMAVYACPYRGCHFRQGWVRDFRTGRPRLLWQGLHHRG